MNDLIDLSARILKHLINNQRFKQITTILINNIDPESGDKLARVIVEEDIEFFLTLLSSTPKIINSCLVTCTAIIEKLLSLPWNLLEEYIGLIIKEIDNTQINKIEKAISSIPQDKRKAVFQSLGEKLGTYAGKIREEANRDGSELNIFLKSFLEGYNVQRR